MPSEELERQIKTQSIPLTGDPTIIKIHLQSCIDLLRDEDGMTRTRELSLSVTKLQEAIFWIDEHLRMN